MFYGGHIAQKVSENLSGNLYFKLIASDQGAVSGGVSESFVYPEPSSTLIIMLS